MEQNDKLNEEMKSANSTNAINENSDEKNMFEKLKGDTIGDTMYSERFVLKTLLALQDVKWNENFETELCTLWDMTTDSDVAIYLANNNFFDILMSSIVNNLENVRFVEILIGITANICSKSECIQILFSKTETVDFLFSLLTYPDACTLIQLIRYFQIVLCNKNTNCSLTVLEKTNDETFLNNLVSVIKNSTKVELLTEIFKFLCCVAYYEKELERNQNILLNHTILMAFVEFLDENNNFQDATREIVDLISSCFNVLVELSFFLNTVEIEQFDSYKVLLFEFKPILRFLCNLLNDLLFSDQFENMDLNETLNNLNDVILGLNIYDRPLLLCLLKACKSIEIDNSLCQLIHLNIICLLIFANIQNLVELFKNCSHDDRKFLLNLVENFKHVENSKELGLTQDHVEALKSKLFEIKLD